MFFELMTHQYFWISFFPISFLGIGFWLLFFEREKAKKDPLWILLLAVTAGGLSALLFQYVSIVITLENIILKVGGEEITKVIFAIIAMEIGRNQFKSIAGGVVYGFSVGLGFALVENLFYLARMYELVGFQAEFWITFQGRFWSSTILHGITTALFGLFYAGAYLSKTVHKGAHESPLRAFFILPSFQAFIQIVTFHVSRKHLLLNHFPTLTGHLSRAVILEGLLLAILMHLLFNLAIEYSHPEVSFLIALVGMWFLKQKVKRVS